MSSDADVTPEIIKLINILEGLENLLDIAPDAKIALILQEAWLKVSDTFPEDFREATKEDAGAEGLRLYIRVKAFFANPTENPISQEDLKAYYQNHAQPIDEDSAEFFFPN